ncbi:glucosaminidase domain-containing protein [Pseudoneobacillus sp. C159]
MSIGDEWFIKSMIVNTLYRTEKQQFPQSKSVEQELNNKNFSTIINQLLSENNMQLMLPTLPIAINSNINLNGEIQSIRFQSISAEQLNQSLDGKLKGMGEIFLREGKRFNIDPALLVAIAKHETGNGHSNAAHEKNNIAGMMGSNGLKTYESVEASIIDMTRNLSKNYLDIGLTSIQKIGAKYAPIGANNDPTGLNNHWVNGVTKYYDQLRG